MGAYLSPGPLYKAMSGTALTCPPFPWLVLTFYSIVAPEDVAYAVTPVMFNCTISGCRAQLHSVAEFESHYNRYVLFTLGRRLVAVVFFADSRCVAQHAPPRVSNLWPTPANSLPTRHSP